MKEITSAFEATHTHRHMGKLFSPRSLVGMDFQRLQNAAKLIDGVHHQDGHPKPQKGQYDQYKHNCE
jgi:hypothetical protein